MGEYIPSPRGWVAEQVELYEESGGTVGLTFSDTGMPVIIVTNRGRKTGAIRKTPLMRAAGDWYRDKAHVGEFELKVCPRSSGAARTRQHVVTQAQSRYNQNASATGKAVGRRILRPRVHL